jgi:hypothetical protein
MGKLAGQGPRFWSFAEKLLPSARIRKKTIRKNGSSLNSLEFKSKPDFARVLWLRIRNFLGLTDPDQSLFVWIQTWTRSRPSSSKKANKTLIYTVL